MGIVIISIAMMKTSLTSLPFDVDQTLDVTKGSAVQL